MLRRQHTRRHGRRSAASASDPRRPLGSARAGTAGHRALPARPAPASARSDDRPACGSPAPFLVRTIDPPVTALAGRTVTGLRRLGKRIVIDTGDIAAGAAPDDCRSAPLAAAGAAIPRRIGLAAIDLEAGTLVVTEAGTHPPGLAPHGLRLRRRSPLSTRAASSRSTLDLPAFAARLTSERHTLKRALTDPSLFSGIGNAYSDEILHRARLSPMRMSDALTPRELERLLIAARAVSASSGVTRSSPRPAMRFPEQVTAFRPGMRGARPLRPAVPGVRHRRCNASATPRTKPTTVRPARPTAGCSPTAGCRAC